MEKLIKVLKNSPISEYKINIIETVGNELFYIVDKLETSRAVNLKEVEVTIYINRDDKRGCSSFKYYDYMNEDEIKEEIEKTIYAASFALNPFYEIPAKSDEKPLKIHSNFADKPLSETAQDIARAIFRCKKYDEGFLSATEIFVSKKVIRIINSKGIDVSETRYEGFVEVIPSWGDKENEVETYNSFTFSNFDADWITNKINELLELTKARFVAQPLVVKQNLKVIIEDEGVPMVFSYFSDDLSYADKVRGTGRSDIGDKLQGDNPEGTLLNIDMVPFDEESAMGCGFDSDGVILRPINLIKEGVAMNRYGSYQYGYYFGEKNPTGVLPIVKVEPGTKTFKEMAKEPYLRCCRFSSFQLESNSGYFGGEVRLGFYFDGEKEIPVTGFSIGGTLKELRGKIVFSQEKEAVCRFMGQRLRGYVGPKYLEIKGMNII